MSLRATGSESPGRLGSRAARTSSRSFRDKRRVFTRAECDAAAVAWTLLRSVDASLRIVRDGRLVSALLTHFDALLISQATPDWEVSMRVIGRTMRHLTDEVDPPGQVVRDIILFSRLQAFGDAGGLEISGPGPGMRDYEFRKPFQRADQFIGAD
ncbi:DUF3658 domain-containing protein [Methylobacterium phyllosphaerae]|uniref:DUF3658 domain-containing protein n=1 Tax=Methylobacterium phyllosphaerae TaxID=418223 RepID=UPI0009FB8FD2